MAEARFPYDEIERFVDNIPLQIRIKDFCVATDPIIEKSTKTHIVIKRFHASVYPNGVDKDTEGWLQVFPGMDFHDKGWVSANDVVSCIVSIIDIEGNSRLQRSIDLISDEDFKDGKYLERSLILNRANEFLLEGTLTLLCDFYFTWTAMRISWDKFCGGDEGRETISPYYKQPDLYPSIPQVVCFKEGAEAGNPTDRFTVFDFTHQILTLPQFHESRKRFGIYGISPASSGSSEPKEDHNDFMEHVWIFDTRRDRFLLSLDEHHDNVGTRLVKASPVIRRCVHAPMKEQVKKHIELQNVDSQAFKIVLYFLEKGTLALSRLSEAMSVYKFSHLYEIANLQKKSAEDLVRLFGPPTKKFFKMADLYSDEYLTELLDSCRPKYLTALSQLPKEIVDDRLDSHCYI